MSGAPPLDLRFVMSAPDVASLPDSPAEVAFAGRSNVGKSSLINALANRKALAEVSKTPGRTRFLNLFEVVTPGAAQEPGTSPTVVDLPGYGFAKVPAHVRASWGPMIETYLLEREQLRMVIVLVDGEVGPTKLDIAMLEWVAHNDLPHRIVATKHDKVKASTRESRRKELAEGCGVDSREVLWVSAAKNVNIDTLRSRVRSYFDT